MTVTDYADFNTPQAHATQIAKTGVPLLSNPSVLVTSLLQVIGASGTETFSGVNLTQTGWALNIITSFPAAATTAFVEISMLWTDPVSGTVYGEDHYIVPGSSGASGFSVDAAGFAKSNQVTIMVTNMDTAQAATVSLLFAQDSVIRTADRWRWRNVADNGLAVPGQTMPGLPDDENSLGYMNAVNVNNASSVSFLHGMAPGRLIQLAGHASSSAALNYTLEVRAGPIASYASVGYLQYQVLTQAGFAFTFIGSRGPIHLKVSNNGTAALTFSSMMSAQD